MKPLFYFFLVLIWLSFSKISFGINYSTNTSGSTWNNGLYWNGDGGFPDDNLDNANVSYDMNFGIGLNFTIKNLSVNNATLIIDGTLRVNSLNLNNDAGTIIVNGSLIIDNNVVNTGLSNFIINTGASVTVGGDFDMYNGCDALVNGTLTVSGELNAQSSETDITGSGSISAGSYAGDGTIFGHSPARTLAPGTVMPIELTYFLALTNKTNVTLSWQTATELNNDYFTLERSKDGLNYEIIGTVLGAGISMSALNYSFTDSKPLNGVSYYRLKQTDYDGKFEIFSPVSVSYFNENEIEIGSNPSAKEISIRVNGEMGLGVAEIYNVIGVLVKTIEISDNLTIVNVSDILTGTYILVVSANKTQIIKKIRVQ